MAKTATLFERILAIYPELAENLEEFQNRSIRLQDDGQGTFIAKWNYSKPIPDELAEFVNIQP